MVVKKLLPYGVKDYYPKEVERLKTILQRVEEELTLWGYEEIKLPLLEYRELFETALGKKIKDGFPIADGGEDLALRYDFTPQILRFVIHQKGKNYPLRVYYKGETFKKSRELWEEINVGFELVGAKSVEADAEVIAIISEILNRLGVKEYTLVVGHRKVYDLLVENFGIEPVKRKNFSQLPLWALKNYDLLGEEWKNLELPQGVKEDLKTLAELLKTYTEGRLKVYFSPVLEPERNYYSGVFFKFLHPKGVLARGGRYDNLFRSFGREIPATGGGIKVQKLLEVCEIKVSKPKKVYLIDTTPDKVKSWKLARELRTQGFTVERDIVERNVEDSIKAAREKGYEDIRVID